MNKLALLSIVLSVFIAGCSSPTTESLPPETTDEAVVSTDTQQVDIEPVDIKANIDDSVYEPYEKVNSSQTIEQFGSRLDDIQVLREQFAEHAITSGKCEAVSMSEVKLDSDINNPEFFMFCVKDGKEEQIYSNETDIKAAAPLLNRDEAGLSDIDATQFCVEQIRNNTKEYADVDIHSFADQTFFKMADGSSEVKIGFDVTNALNAKIPYLAKCNFDRDGNAIDFSITQGKR